MEFDPKAHAELMKAIHRGARYQWIMESCGQKFDYKKYLPVKSGPGDDDDDDDDEKRAEAIDADTSDEGMTVRIQGPIDSFFGFDTARLIELFDEESPSAITLLINSPGGYLSEGMALYFDLISRAKEGVKVTAEARGTVASAATLPFIAADTRIVSPETELMVHDPWALHIAMGTADEIQTASARTVGALRAGEKSLRAAYSRRTGATIDTVREWMGAETWFVGAEAVEAGIATEVSSGTSSSGDVSASAFSEEQRAEMRANVVDILSKFRASKAA